MLPARLRYTRVLPVVGTLLLGACHSEKPSRISDGVLPWLPDADGATLRFRNDTAGVQVLTAARQRSIGKLPSTSADNPYEQEELRYTSPAFPERVLRLEAAFGNVGFGLGRPDGTYGSAAILKVGARDTVATAGTRCELLRRYVLRGRTYPVVLHLWLGATPPTATWSVTEVFFARDQGILAYKTNRRQVWYRD